VTIARESLARMIEEINVRLESGDAPSATERTEAVSRILGHQVEVGRNAGAFAPTGRDLAAGVRLWTGEVLRTTHAKWSLLTAEAARLVLLLGASDGAGGASVARARSWLDASCFASRGCTAGECAHSLIGYLRLLATQGEEPDRMGRCLSGIRHRRDGRGRWSGFPFYYTILALSESAIPAAAAELSYAQGACERVGTPRARDPRIRDRRCRLMDGVLAASVKRLL